MVDPSVLERAGRLVLLAEAAAQRFPGEFRGVLRRLVRLACTRPAVVAAEAWRCEAFDPPRTLSDYRAALGWCRECRPATDAREARPAEWAELFARVSAAIDAGGDERALHVGSALALLGALGIRYTEVPGCDLWWEIVCLTERLSRTDGEAWRRLIAELLDREDVALRNADFVEIADFAEITS